MSQQSTLPASAATQTARLLACGIAAGPLFLTVGLTQAFLRDGFDLSRHPLSLLSLGDLGWVQIANFSGACVASAVAVLALAAWPDLDGVSVRLVVASAVMFGFVGVLAAHRLRGLPDRAG